MIDIYLRSTKNQRLAESVFIHYLKSVCVRSYSGPHFPAFTKIQTNLNNTGKHQYQVVGFNLCFLKYKTFKT